MRGRKGDIAMILCQFNRDREIIIQKVLEGENTLRELLGYDSEECVGQPLAMFLPKDIDEKIEDYVEFDDEGIDVGTVLGKVRRFRMLSKGGNQVALDMKIERDIMLDRNARFVMMIRRPVIESDPTLISLKEMKQDEKRFGKFGIPDHDAFMEAAALVQRLVNEAKFMASMGIVQVDHFGSFTEGATDEVLKDTIIACKQTFREYDFIAYLGFRKVGVLLLEADFVNARIALNRLRWHFKAVSESGGNVRFTIVFREIDAAAPIAQIVESCGAALLDPDAKLEGVGVLR